MDTNRPTFSRRGFLTRIGWGAAALGAPALFARHGAFAEELARTPRQTEGPFYPDRLPLDTDNDLLVVNDAITPAVGEITHLTGRILDAGGEPLRHALVEIWQCDGNGAYLHTKTSNVERRDRNFQGFGRFLTGSTGEYYFRTIKPVPYPGRTPHIHFKVKVKGREALVTQCYIKGHPGNEKDGIFKALGSRDQAALLVDWIPIKESRIGEQAAKFDLVIGHTAEV